MIYQLARILAAIVLKFSFFLKIEGADNYRSIPGGYLAICNHISNWDPIVLGYSIKKRPVCYMAKEELFKNPIARFLLTRLHAIPLARGAGDVGAVKKALRALADGKILGIFPEGTRSRDGRLHDFEPGAALLALRSGVPVLPAYISGDYRMFHRVTITFGAPIDLKGLFPGKVNSVLVREATQYLHEKLLSMENV